MKRIDVFIGVKAEQTLRDTARAASEEVENTADVPELCPVGKKDWIAGERIGEQIAFHELNDKRQSVLKKLIDLKSHQRIRQDNLRVYAVRPPVPVFRDPVAEETNAFATIRENQVKDAATCPICGSEVHSYNIQYDPWGQMVGCYLCRGERRSD